MNQVIKELAGTLISQNGVCPPPEQRTPEQKAVLAKAGILTFVAVASDRFLRASKALALATPRQCTPCSIDEMEAELTRQAEALALEMFRVFPKEGAKPAEPTSAATVNPRGYSSEQKVALKRIITLGYALDAANTRAAVEVLGRLRAKVDQVNDRIGRHVGQGYELETHAALIADAEQLILDLERLF